MESQPHIPFRAATHWNGATADGNAPQLNPNANTNPNATANMFPSVYGAPFALNPAASAFSPMQMMLLGNAMATSLFMPGAYGQHNIPQPINTNLSSYPVHGSSSLFAPVEERILVDRIFVGRLEGLSDFQSIESLVSSNQNFTLSWRIRGFMMSALHRLLARSRRTSGRIFTANGRHISTRRS